MGRFYTFKNIELMGVFKDQNIWSLIPIVFILTHPPIKFLKRKKKWELSCVEKNEKDKYALGFGRW